MNGGKFVISLDFELYWGVRDKKTIEQYGQNIKGVHKAIPRLLDLFDKFQVKATFATVGFLFFQNKRELLDNIPSKLPNYDIKKLSPYIDHFDSLGESFPDDSFHYAPHLIKLIQQYPGQEIGSHTFSHYYCLEKGQTVEDFEADMIAAKHVAEKYKTNLTSLVFPRNQFNDQYLKICSELGIICYRGNEHSWLYKAKSEEEESLFRRLLRLVDAYINISGHNCYSDDYMKSKFPVDIPSSRFLRPYSKKLSILDFFKLNRIKTGMSYAAKNNLTYHLWWHPHNFGVNQDRNFLFLEKILIHFQHLKNKYNFQSLSMSQLAKSIYGEQ